MFSWDHYSDQPSIIKDKKLKRKIYLKTLPSFLKLILTNLLLSPFILFRYLLGCKCYQNQSEIFALGVSLENQTPDTFKRLKELKVKHLLVRFPLSKIKEIQRYKEFIDNLSGFDVMINLIQDRSHIEDLELLKKDVRVVFKTFKAVKEYQVGTTINRKKWAFFSVEEYLSFSKTIEDLRDSEFKDISLVGSSVIDFEYHYSIRSLFNLYKIYYDRFSALLYVDRRGSPFNTQLGFDLFKKIKLLFCILTLSKKSSNDIYITETNWPISGTAPYAPTSEKECVSLQEYSYYMVAYYLISMATKCVKRVYWHQLEAKGYGLVDQISNKKYPSFFAYKVMVDFLAGKNMLKYSIDKDIKEFEFEDITVYYSDGGFEKSFIKEGDLDIFANEYKEGKVLYRWKIC